MRILSWGLGLQSTLLLEMSARGQLPKLDAAIFADTGYEHDHSHDVFKFYTPRAEKAGIRVIKIGGQDIYQDNFNHVTLPLFISGTDRMIKRKCTRDYKIRPIQRVVRQLLGVNPRGRLRANLVELWLGITTDEITRAKDSRVAYITHQFPLLDIGYNRGDCEQDFINHGLPVPKKSSCVFCPYQKKGEWREKNEQDITLIADLQGHINQNGLIKIGGQDKQVSFIPWDGVNAPGEKKRLEQDAMCDGGFCNS